MSVLIYQFYSFFFVSIVLINKYYILIASLYLVGCYEN